MQCLKHIKMPRFLVASDLGSVVSCGLKTDTVLAEYRDGHCGTVHSVHRSQAADIVTGCNHLLQEPAVQQDVPDRWGPQCQDLERGRARQQRDGRPGRAQPGARHRGQVSRLLICR